MANVLLISDTSDGQNWGCFMTSKKLRQAILESEDIIDTKFIHDTYIPKVDFIFPDIDDITYILSEYYKIISESEAFPEKVYKYGVLSNMHFWDYIPKKATQFSNRAEKFVNNQISREYFNQIKNIDHVVINGEGSIHDAGNKFRNKAWSLLFLAYVAKKELNLPTHIVNHTLEINTERLRSAVELIYPQLDSIVFRDRLSYRNYNNTIGEGNIIQGADAAWLFSDDIPAKDLNKFKDSGVISIWYPNNEQKNIDFSRRYITIGCGSGFQQSKQKLSTIFTKIVNQISDTYPNMDILLTAASFDDERVMLNVSQNTKKPLLKLNNAPELAASIIGNSSLYLGGRWHPSIFALMGSAELVNFKGNTYKIDSLKQEFDTTHPIYSCNSEDLNIDTIISSVQQGLDQGFHGTQLTNHQICEMRNLAKKSVQGTV